MLYRIKFYKEPLDYMFNKPWIVSYEVDWKIEKIERFIDWYHALTGYMPIVEYIR